MSTLTLESVLARCDSLPRLPEAAVRLVEALQNPGASATQIVEALRYDPSMTVELLRLCNSAFYSRGREILSVDEAVVRLGNGPILQLVLAAYSRTLLAPAQTGWGLPPGALWRHSVGVALASRALGRGLSAEEVGAAFTAGLLHDVGKVALNEFMTRRFAAVVARVARQRIPFPEAEQEELGFTHAEVGAHLAEQWGLPASIIRCIRHHHAPAELPKPVALVDVVHLADVACLLMGIGGGDDGSRYRADRGALARVGLTPQQFERIGAETVIAVKQVESAWTARAA